jgi:hypothetical protein
MRRVVNPRDTPILGAGGCWTNPKGLGSNGSYLVSWQTAYQVAVERVSTRKTSGESDLGRPVSVVAESRLRVSPRHSPFYCRFQ